MFYMMHKTTVCACVRIYLLGYVCAFFFNVLNDFIKLKSFRKKSKDSVYVRAKILIYFLHRICNGWPRANEMGKDCKIKCVFFLHY